MLEHQFMDMRILSRIQVDHLLGKLSSPLIPYQQLITGLGSPRQLRQVAMSPHARYSHHEFMNMAVAPRVHDLFGAIRFPGIASKSNAICCRGTRKLIHQVCIAPRVALSYDQFVDMSIPIHRTDVGNLLCVSIRPGIASHDGHL